jgi:DeoR/GlpR family transcriptional regulator of sugar metabolism
MFELKLELHRDLKEAVARAASQFVEDGDSIILDSGTTCLYLARRLLAKKRLRILTTDIKIAAELARNGDIETNILGGVVRPGFYTVGGVSALENLNRFAADKVFLSVDAIDMELGITNASEFEVGIKQRLLQRGKRIYILADVTKFNTHTLHRVGDFVRINTVITNHDLDPRFVQYLRDQGIEVVLAQCEAARSEAHHGVDHSPAQLLELGQRQA